MTTMGWQVASPSMRGATDHVGAVEWWASPRTQCATAALAHGTFLSFIFWILILSAAFSRHSVLSEIWLVLVSVTFITASSFVSLARLPFPV
ncbi:hypothetical protein EDB85DRAFT_165509 [Lactarius pseudohatsudake]|nr:hypothetical protein EDB85DRAFT_165509 [Lactarius pseudohatsudake]